MRELTTWETLPGNKSPPGGCFFLVAHVRQTCRNGRTISTTFNNIQEGDAVSRTPELSGVLIICVMCLFKNGRYTHTHTHRVSVEEFLWPSGWIHLFEVFFLSLREMMRKNGDFCVGFFFFFSGSGGPERSRKTDDDFFLFSQQQGSSGERSRMPKPVSSSCSPRNGSGSSRTVQKSQMRQTL